MEMPTEITLLIQVIKDASQYSAFLAKEGKKTNRKWNAVSHSFRPVDERRR